MKKGFRALCLVIFAIGIMSFSLALQKRANDVEVSRPFVAVYYEAQASPDGKRTVTGWRTRYVKTNGEFRVVMHGSDAAAAFANDTTGFAGTSSPVFAGTPEGVFAKVSGSDERKSMSQLAPESMENQFHSHSFLNNHGQLVRKDVVAGLEVYVLRGISQENPNYWIECSYSPLTGRTPLRTITHELDGSSFILEAVKVEFKDVPDNLNDDIKTLPNTGNLGDKTIPPKQ